MPRKSSRDTRRPPVGLIILSAMIIGSLTLSAVISLVDPVMPPPVTSTPEFFVTILPPLDMTPSPTPPGEPTQAAPTPGPALAPTP